METVVITGGIGSGKSAVASYLASKGMPVYSADDRTKDLYDRRPALVEKLETLFAVPLRRPDGTLDRKKLAGIIFSDPEALSALEAVVHPAVLEDFIAWRDACEGPLVVLESAIILSKPLFDGIAGKVILVDAPEPLRIARAMARDGVDEETVRARIRAQVTDWSKVDLVLLNDGTLRELEERVDRAFRFLFPEEILTLYHL